MRFSYCLLRVRDSNNASFRALGLHWGRRMTNLILFLPNLGDRNIDKQASFVDGNEPCPACQPSDRGVRSCRVERLPS